MKDLLNDNRVLNTAKTLAGAALYGTIMWVDPPAPIKLRVNPDPQTRRVTRKPHAPRQDGVEAKMVLLDLEFLDQDKAWQPCAIEIDTVTKRLGIKTTSWLIGKRHGSSGDLGAAIISAPVALVLSPILLAISGVYKTSERIYGMSRHAQAIVRKLRGQLDDETMDLLIETLKNEWVRDQKLTRSISFKEAQDILGGLPLVEEFSDNDPIQGPWRAFHWRDDAGDVVARGSFFGQRDHFVDILGSRFEDAEADALVTCYASRDLRDHSEPKAS